MGECPLVQRRLAQLALVEFPLVQRRLAELDLVEFPLVQRRLAQRRLAQLVVTLRNSRASCTSTNDPRRSHARRPSRRPCVRTGRAGARATGASGSATYSVLQPRLLLLLPARSTVHPADGAGHSRVNIPLGLRQRAGPATVHTALARRGAARSAR